MDVPIGRLRAHPVAGYCVGVIGHVGGGRDGGCRRCRCGRSAARPRLRWRCCGGRASAGGRSAAASRSTAGARRAASARVGGGPSSGPTCRGRASRRHHPSRGCRGRRRFGQVGGTGREHGRYPEQADRYRRSPPSVPILVSGGQNGLTVPPGSPLPRPAREPPPPPQFPRAPPSRASLPSWA